MKKSYCKPTVQSEQAFETSALECAKSTATPYGFIWTVTNHHTGSSHSMGTGSPFVTESLTYEDGLYCGYGDVEPNNLFVS